MPCKKNLFPSNKKNWQALKSVSKWVTRSSGWSQNLHPWTTMSILEFFAHVAKTLGIEPTEVQKSINLTFFALPLTLVLQWHGPGDAKNSQAAPSHTATVPGVFVAFFFFNGHIHSHLLQSPQTQLFTPSVSILVLFPSQDGKSCSQLGHQIRFWPSGHMALGRFAEKVPLNSAVAYGTYPGNKSFTACCCQTYWRLSQPSSIPPSGWCLGPQISEIQPKSGPELSPKKLLSATPELDWERFSANLLFHLRHRKLEDSPPPFHCLSLQFGRA